MKTRMYEDVMDERDAPKPASKPIDQWDHTALRRAMMDDARKMKSPDAYSNHSSLSGSTEERTLGAMRKMGKPCTRQEFADWMEVTKETARKYLSTLIMAGHVTTDRDDDGVQLYLLTEGYDGQKLLELE